jgi:hypothetical protein
MSGAELMAVIGFGIMIFGTIFGAWRWIDGKIGSAKSDAMNAATVASAKADITSAALNEHKLHVAETYLTKAGLREQMEPLFDAVKGVSGQVQNMNERLDRVIEGRAPGRAVKHSA